MSNGYFFKTRMEYSEQDGTQWQLFRMSSEA